MTIYPEYPGASLTDDELDAALADALRYGTGVWMMDGDGRITVITYQDWIAEEDAE